MKKSIELWQFGGFTFVCVLGTILHFLYDWTNVSFVSFLSSVNESTFEHMKILFFPMLIFAVLESFFFKKEYSNYWSTKLKGILIGLILIPTLFYTLGGIFGTLSGWVNVLIFFISPAISYKRETKSFDNGVISFEKISFVIIIFNVVFIFFVSMFKYRCKNT